MNIDIKISNTPIVLEDCLKQVSDNGCGGIATFSGTVRNQTKGKTVIRLEYECYESMATKEIRKICLEANARFSVKNILVHHRIGTLYPGDNAIIIAVADTHRDRIFDACSFLIDNIKARVPIWKKEFFETGEEWVSAHP